MFYITGRNPDFNNLLVLSSNNWKLIKGFKVEETTTEIKFEFIKCTSLSSLEIQKQYTYIIIIYHIKQNF